jgi:hypothetical protein
MSGFAVYSVAPEPKLLYETGELDGIDPDTTSEMVWVGDRPVHLVVDLGERRLWWVFEATRGTHTTTTRQYIAAYQTDGDLFREFAEELRTLHHTADWDLPYTDDIHSETGLKLYRMPATVDHDEQDALDRLIDRVTGGQLTHDEPAVPVGMQTYRDALRIVRALDAADVDCTVAIDEGYDLFAFRQIDLLFVPGAVHNFDRQEDETTTSPFLSEKDASDTTASTATGDPGPADANSLRAQEALSFQDQSGSLLTVLLVGALLLLSAYSLFRPAPVQPISSLATFGGFVGSIVAVQFWTATTERTLSRSRLGSVVAIGTLAGFVYPTLFWELGVALGQNGFLLGPVTELESSVYSALVYAAVLYTGTLVGGTLFADTHRHRGVSFKQLGRRGIAIALFSVSLVIATGFAAGLWFDYIPAATL